MTQISPVELMFSRKLRYTIPDISSKPDNNVGEEAKQNDQRIKEKLKRYQDQTQHMQTRIIDIGTRVIVKHQKRNKLAPTSSQYPYVVTNVKESMITAVNKNTGHTVTRNISFFKVIPLTTKDARARIAIGGKKGNIAYHRCLNKQLNNQNKFNNQ